MVLGQIGFEMIDAISEAEDIPLRTIQHKALLGKGTKFYRASGVSIEIRGYCKSGGRFSGK